MLPHYTIKPLSARALLVQFADELSEAVNRQVIALHRALAARPFPGFTESVPGYTALGVFFDAGLDLYGPILGREYALSGIAAALEKMEMVEPEAGKLIEIPVVYGGNDGPDIEWVAERNKLSVPEVIALHTGKIYTVFMLGFLPGFPYMGITDSRLTVERKATPRPLVPAGSVGLAGNQTGIYPAASPGGWQIIGRTGVELFNPHKNPPSLLQPGDRVRFVAQ